MTTIAWDGKEYRVRKVHKRTDKDGKPVLVAVTGNGSWVMAWLEHKFGKGDHPGVYFDADMKRPHVIALVVDSKRRVWEYGTHGLAIQRLGRLHTAGAGCEMALGAMAAGASARGAIRICIKHSECAGFGVDAVSF